MPHILIFLALFMPWSASAYPEFIGYKYASCLTCHFNGHGNGPLNDYGRALWAAEIGGRAFAFGRTDEELGQASGFLGSVQFPFWIRPGLKGRQLVMKPNPPSSGAYTRNITMQADANLAIFFDRNQKYGFIGSIGYVPEPQRYANIQGGKKIEEMISREHYVRVLYGENLWLYAGMLDKVYGIRHVNHTAFNRAKLGFGQNDQAHSFIAHYIQPKYEFTVDLFMGNLFQDAKLRQKGVSTLYEYEPAEAWRIGGSALYSFNDYIKNGRVGVFNRYGFGDGSALLGELGLIHDDPKVGDAKLGYYFYGQAIQKLYRGYHVFVVGQLYKDDMKAGRPDLLRTGAGLLIFPASRFEWRVELENGRQFTDSAEVQRESWIILTQLHVSL